MVKTSNRNSERRALLITYPDDLIIEEFVELALAAEYEPVSTQTQKYLSGSKYGISESKVRTIKDSVEDLNVGVILVDESLRTTQIYNLAKIAKVEVKDREKLILEIFNRRASSAETKLQVQLAEISYDMPRAKEKVRLAKLSEQPGFHGLGVYEIDVLFRSMKRRRSLIKKKIIQIRKRRELHRTHRRRGGFPIISLSGYTGAGKTMLFNVLTAEHKEEGSGVFTTLSTYTRKMMIENRKVMLSDTVGFISRLPTYMVEAFRSTLEELNFADLILLVMDSSHDVEEMERRYRSSKKIFAALKVSSSNILYVLNKVDLSSQEQVIEKALELKLPPDKVILTSAKESIGMEHLKKRISDYIPNAERVDPFVRYI